MLDLVEILKNCPRGTKFYSYIFGEETYFLEIDSRKGNPLPIIICGKYGENQTFRLSQNGHPYANTYGECVLFPSKDQRDWSKFIAPWYKKEKFDPKTLKPFDRVLARKDSEDSWNIDFFSCFRLVKIPCCLGGIKCAVIPYNDDTKYLIGTTEEASEYYRYWE